MSWQRSANQLLSKLTNLLHEHKEPTTNQTTIISVENISTEHDNKLGLLDILTYAPCLSVIINFLNSHYMVDSLLNINLTCKALYNITQPVVSERFLLRITGDLSFTRRTFTNVVLYNNKLPSRETILLHPAIKRVHLIGYDSSTSYYLPPSVTRLSLSSSQNIPIPPHLLPPLLTHLRLPAAFDSPVGVDNLPHTLTHLCFGKAFNQPIENMPQNITHLVFGASFNRPIDHLPAALVLFCAGVEFNQPIDSIPRTLQYLRLGRRFSHSTNNLPDTLINLTIRCIRDSSDQLPPRLQYLKVQLQEQTLPPLPSTLTSLVISTIKSRDICAESELPQSLRILILMCGTFEWLGPSHVTLAQLPSCLKTLSLWDDFNFAEENLFRFINLTHLNFQKDFNDKVDGRLPPNLTTLSLGEKFNYSVDDLPSHLAFVYLGKDFNQPLNHLPSTLRGLVLESRNYTHPLKSLPATILDLTVKGLSTTFFIDFVPSKVRHLSISTNLPQLSRSICIHNLPPTLASIVLSTNDQTSFFINNLPPNLHHLSLNGTYEIESGAILPPSLQRLALLCKINKKLDTLPPSLTRLDVGSKFNHSLPTFPPHLRVFNIVGETFPHSFKPVFPPRLFHARLPCEHIHLVPDLHDTCHLERGFNFTCSLCDDLRMIGSFDLMNEDDETWISATFKGLWFI